MPLVIRVNADLPPFLAKAAPFRRVLWRGIEGYEFLKVCSSTAPFLSRSFFFPPPMKVLLFGFRPRDPTSAFPHRLLVLADCTMLTTFLFLRSYSFPFRHSIGVSSFIKDSERSHLILALARPRWRSSCFEIHLLHCDWTRFWPPAPFPPAPLALVRSDFFFLIFFLLFFPRGSSGAFPSQQHTASSSPLWTLRPRALFFT